MIRIMLADDNRDFLEMLSAYIYSQPDMEIVGIAYHGEDILQKLAAAEESPDILLLDVIMPHLDGLGVLERMPHLALDPVPKIIMLTAFGQEQITQRAVELGASYYMLKPFDLNVLGSRIRQLVGALQQESAPKPRGKHSKKADVSAASTQQPVSLDAQITAVLNEIGVPPHLKGFQYLREAIMLVYHNVEIMGAVTKVLYPQIADSHNSNPSRIERGIRHSIEVSWTRGNREAFARVFGYERKMGQSKPSNSEFIAMVADKLRVDHGNT